MTLISQGQAIQSLLYGMGCHCKRPWCNPLMCSLWLLICVIFCCLLTSYAFSKLFLFILFHPIKANTCNGYMSLFLQSIYFVWLLYLLDNTLRQEKENCVKIKVRRHWSWGWTSICKWNRTRCSCKWTWSDYCYWGSYSEKLWCWGMSLFVLLPCLCCLHTYFNN